VDGSRDALPEKGGVENMQCRRCAVPGPEGEGHYHVMVEGGVVTGLWYVSGDGYWDRELEKTEYFVEYTDVRKIYG
jgi:hypothetical protein